MLVRFRLLLTCLFFFSFSLTPLVAFSVEGPKADTDLKQIKLIPRSLLFSDPQYTRVRISPDGKHLAYLAPHQGALNIWVGEPRHLKTMKPLTQQTRSIQSYTWSYNNRHILYFSDIGGDEDWRLFRVDTKTGEEKALASFKKVRATFIGMSQKFPDEVLIGLNQRRSDFHDVYRLNIQTGKMEKIYENNHFSNFITDEDLNLCIAQECTPEGGAIVYSLDKNFNKTKLLEIGVEDILTTSTVGLNKKGDVLYILDSRNRNTSALSALDLKTNKITLIAEDPKSDVEEVMLHPDKKIPQSYATNYTRRKWSVLDKSMQSDVDYLNQLANGELLIVNQTLDDKIWIVAYIRDNGPYHYYYYDRPTKKAEFLFSAKPSLESAPLVKMESVIIPSRDNYSLVSYLSLPNSVQQEKEKIKTSLPLVLLVHGGPNVRDRWGYYAIHQWLANRGFAVLSVNYRGSSGFGKKFANAGNGEWGGKMHDDLIDVVQWAIKQGITTKDKVAIMGASYGGYATLIGLTKTPDVFVCGIDIVGPSNLETFLKTIPDYWKPHYNSLKIRIGGGPETEKGREYLASRSPLTFVDNIKKPLLIAQGANDPRIKQAESEQIVQKMQSKGIPVTYVLYPDEGHGFSRYNNSLSFFAVAEAFLAQNFGSQFEPINNDFKDSSIQIKVGKEHIPALMEVGKN
jgi:dipeptidyl aminopeptidase/acylaminoacyl peptidase